MVDELMGSWVDSLEVDLLRSAAGLDQGPADTEMEFLALCDDQEDPWAMEDEVDDENDICIDHYADHAVLSVAESVTRGSDSRVQAAAELSNRKSLAPAPCKASSEVDELRHHAKAVLLRAATDGRLQQLFLQTRKGTSARASQLPHVSLSRPVHGSRHRRKSVGGMTRVVSAPDLSIRMKLDTATAVLKANSSTEVPIATRKPGFLAAPWALSSPGGIADRRPTCGIPACRLDLDVKAEPTAAALERMQDGVPSLWMSPSLPILATKQKTAVMFRFDCLPQAEPRFGATTRKAHSTGALLRASATSTNSSSAVVLPAIVKPNRQGLVAGWRVASSLGDRF